MTLAQTAPVASLQKRMHQKTLRSSGKVAGVGLFTGEKVSVTIRPAAVGTGIVFRRKDLPGTPEFRAHFSLVNPAPRCTRLGKGDASIFLVEHLLSALYGYGIDNAVLDVEGPEIPVGDGSAKIFTDLLDSLGLKEQSAPKRFAKVQKPVFWSEQEIHLIALPSDEFRVSYTLHYPNSPLLQSQYYSFVLNGEKYREEIARCRTFSLYEEILPFIEKGMIRGGGLENALVIHGDKILNPGGAHFPDEMVRHKILDLLGDLSLIGRPILGHIIAIRSGHASNVAFAKLLAKATHCDETVRTVQ